ncbi:leucine-rich repeat protein [Finegoldia sp. BIOML-A1]|uniref:leucine-rich repeat protein n=1 Tax=Finegoldia sp. BIOML-A1 TaxID=2584649 RepID=UPI0012B0A841|nr:leucine-rich repeat protein [Finegoldia sp. BIOML-A1]MSB11247.1 leucine-rich repeat protein [Finegoldia sp. BIOML-A1]
MNRKRIVSWILIFAMVIGFAPVNIYASDVPQKQEVTAESDFDFDESSATIKKYNGTATDVVIPEKINGKAVTNIGKGAFARKGLTSVVIPEGVETIDQGAFSANSLTTIKLPSTVKQIERLAFGMNKNLSKIELNEGLEYIGQQAFMNDSSLAGEITIPSTVKTVMTTSFNKTGVTGLLLKGDEKSNSVLLKSSLNGETIKEIKSESPFKHIRINFNSLGTGEGDKYLDLGKVEAKAGSKKELQAWLDENINTDFIATYVDKKDNTGSSDKEVELAKVWNLDKFDKTKEFEVFASIDKEKASKLEQIEGYTSPCVTCSATNLMIKLTVKLGESEQPEQPTTEKWSQEDFTYGQFKYKGRMEEESYRFGITGFSEKGKAKLAKNPDLVIPKEVTIDGQKKAVEGVKESSFRNQKINSVTFPKTDVEFIIKDYAFANSGITKVKFEEGLKSIESYAFRDNKLTEVYIPSTVWKTGSESFMNNEISKLEISDDVNSIQIDNYSFANNKLSVVKLPYSIFKFRDFVFRDNPGYENSKVVRLETRNPDHLKSVTYIVPENDYHKVVLVTNVDRSKLFKELQTVKSIVKSDYKQEKIDEFDNVLQEAKRIFKDEKSTQEQVDKALDDLIEAEGNLRKSAPDRSKLRDSIKKADELVPEMFEKESYDAMKKELDKAKIVLADLDKSSDEVKSAQENLDKSVDALVINKNSLYKKEDFTYKDNAITGFSDSGKAKFKFNKNLILPDTTLDGKDVEVIAESAFDLIKDEGVKFGTDTVSSANGMTSLELPKKLKRIENYAFRVNNFENVELPDTLEYIGGSAFNGNRLEKVYLPDSVTKVEGGAFSLNQITELRISPNMTEIAGGTFSRNIKLEKLEIPEGIKVIGPSAFQGAPLKQLTISKTVEEIKDRAFTGHQLEELTIPGNVKKIERQAFAHNIKWKRLKKLTLEEGIEEIGDSAFRFSLLKETNLPKSLKKLSDDAFKDAETTDKKHVVVKLNTQNKKHLEFNNEKSLKNQKVVFNETTVEDIKDTDTLKEIFEKIPATRIAGRNRQLTAVEVSKTLFQKADTVIITSSDKMVDSLASSPYGVGKNAPTLLVEKDSIMDEVLQEIKRLNPSKIIIAGGKLSVSEKVENQIKQLGIKQQRIAGHDRFETAVKLGEQVRANSTNKKEIILVNGFNNIDALTAGSLASKLNIPVLLTENDQLNETTEKAIKDWGIEKVTIIGGKTQVSEKIEEKLQNSGLKVDRLAGRTRVDTALEVAKAVNSDPDKVIFANKTAYPDALIAPYLSKTEQAPIMLIDKDEASVSVKQYLRDNKIKDSIILGGKLSIEEYK